MFSNVTSFKGPKHEQKGPKRYFVCKLNFWVYRIKRSQFLQSQNLASAYKIEKYKYFKTDWSMNFIFMHLTPVNLLLESNLQYSKRSISLSSTIQPTWCQGAFFVLNIEPYSNHILPLFFSASNLDFSSAIAFFNLHFVQTPQSEKLKHYILQSTTTAN